MKNQKKRMLLLLAALLLLVAALALVKWQGWTQADVEAASSASVSASAETEAKENLSAFASANITEILYEWQGAAVHAVKVGDAWQLPEDATPLNQTTLNSMAVALGSLEPERVLSAEESKNLAEYGLDAPQLTATATAGGSSQTVYFGAENTVTGDVYLRVEGSETVYLVPAAKLYALQYTPAEILQGADDSANSSLTQDEEDGHVH